MLFQAAGKLTPLSSTTSIVATFLRQNRRCWGTLPPLSKTVPPCVAVIPCRRSKTTSIDAGSAYPYTFSAHDDVWRSYCSGKNRYALLRDKRQAR